MFHLIKPLAFKPPRLVGMSVKQIDSLFEIQYGLEVRKLNKLSGDCANHAESQMITDCVGKFELHFAGLGENPGSTHGKLKSALISSFGSVSDWRGLFHAVLSEHSSESGWLILSWSTAHNALENNWVSYADSQNDIGIPIVVVGFHPLGYELDFDTDRSAFLDAYLHNTDWDTANSRFNAAIRGKVVTENLNQPESRLTAEWLADQIQSEQGPFVLDVRLKDDLRPDDDRISGSLWMDPGKVQIWGETLPRDRTVVIYCMYGFWVSQDTTEALNNLGVNAKYLSGGISAWRALGGAVEPV